MKKEKKVRMNGNRDPLPRPAFQETGEEASTYPPYQNQSLFLSTKPSAVQTHTGRVLGHMIEGEKLSFKHCVSKLEGQSGSPSVEEQ